MADNEDYRDDSTAWNTASYPVVPEVLSSGPSFVSRVNSGRGFTAGVDSDAANSLSYTPQQTNASYGRNDGYMLSPSIGGSNRGIYTSYAGTDIVAQIIVPGEGPLTLGELETFSYSIHREKTPVRMLGSVNPKGFLSGSRCLPASENVFVRGRGPISIADVEIGDEVQSSGSEYNKVEGVFHQGYKQCYRLELVGGYSLTASYDHPISTTRGWVEMQYLQEDDEVYIAGGIPVEHEDYPIDDNLLKMLGYLIADGKIQYYTKNTGSVEHGISLAINEEEMDTVGYETEQILNEMGIPFYDHYTEGCVNRRISVCLEGYAATSWNVRRYNSLHKTLLEYDMYGSYSHIKFIPEVFLSELSRRQIGLFLSCLFSADGGYSWDTQDERATAFYTSTSERLVDQIRILLGRVGVLADKNVQQKVGKKGGRDNIISRHDTYSLEIKHSLNILKFIKRIGIYGKDDRIMEYVPRIKQRVQDAVLDVDTRLFLNAAQAAARKVGKTPSSFPNMYNYNHMKGITPSKALRFAEGIGDPSFSNWVNSLIDDLIDAENDFVSVPIFDKKLSCDLPVYDIEVNERHSFIANFVHVHNTVAGTMIIMQFNNYIFYRLEQYARGVKQNFYPLGDMLPPFDMVLTFANEYGVFSKLRLFGVNIIDEGGTMSVEDLVTEGTMNYMAKGIQPLTGHYVEGLD